MELQPENKDAKRLRDVMTKEGQAKNPVSGIADSFSTAEFSMNDLNVVINFAWRALS